MKFVKYIFISLLLTSCTSVPPAEFVDAYTDVYSDIYASVGQYGSQMYKLDCSSCQTTVTIMASATERTIPNWASMLGVMLLSYDQQYKTHIAIIYYEKGNRFLAMVSSGESGIEPATFWLGESRLGRKEKFNLAWINSELIIEHNGKNYSFNLGYRPFSFGHFVSGIKGNVTFSNNTLFASNRVSREMVKIGVLDEKSN